MLFPREFINQVRDRFNISEIVRKKVVLKTRGREHTGLCPFHNEKSPSFTVNDEKGFYHCFGCGAHGYIFDFIMQTEGLSFPEAVERLAIEAGMPIPKSDPREKEKYDHLSVLMSCAEAAAKYFQDNLKNTLGENARRYFAGRGLTEQTIEEFRLGFCPDASGRMQEALVKQGFTIPQMNEIGLIRNGYEIFRGRAMFPITDSKGRVIAFGGRILEKGEPKYLNSPETPIFHKRRILFGKAIARKYVHELKDIIVTEGYMDTIALNQAGFKNAVAPLGTSLTDEHLAELWAMAPEPTLCFDGDNAGKRAAERAAYLALPLLKPGFSLKFIQLPNGQDPDDVVKSGKGAFAALLADSKPLSEIIFEAEKAKKPIKTPEQQADLKSRLEALAAAIKETNISKKYIDYFRQRLWQEFRQQGQPKNVERSLNISNIVGIEAEKEKILQLEAAVLGLLIANPRLLKDTNRQEELSNLEFSHLEIDRLRQNILFSATCDFESDDFDEEAFKIQTEQFTNGLDGKLASYLNIGKAFPAQWGNPEIAWGKLIEQLTLLLAETDYKNSSDGDDFSEEDFIKLQEMRKQLAVAKNKISFGD
jgi:DNA primase